MSLRAKLFVVVLMSFAAVQARAGDLALNLGAIEVVAMPDGEHFALYPYVGIGYAIALESVVVIPGLSLEWAPELGRWGAVGTCVVDVPVGDSLGVDAVLTLLHDQDGGQWDAAEVHLGLGLGVSLIFGSLTVSPSVSYFHGLNVDVWSIVPGLNFSHIPGA